MPAAWSRVLDRWIYQAIRWQNRIPAPPLFLPITWTGLVLSLWIPGYAFAAVNRRRMAWWMAGTWLVAAVVLMLFMGNPVIRSWALGTLASTHTSGIAFLILRNRELSPDTPPPSLPRRVLTPLLLWIAAAAFVYWPADDLIQRRAARPVKFEGRSIIVNPRSDPSRVARGQTVLYRIDGHNYREGGQPFALQPGMGLAQVLGMPGDAVEFTPTGVRINGRLRPPDPHMPNSGQFIVAPKTWFIWPRFQVTRGNVSPSLIQEAFLDQATVPQANFIGRPYHHWFFHRQDIP